MPVYEIKYIVAPVRIHVVSVKQINVCRIRACRTRTFGIVVRIIVDSYYFAPVSRLLFVNGRNRFGFVHQPRIVLRTVGCFGFFLSLIRRQGQSIFFRIRAGSHAQTAKRSMVCNSILFIVAFSMKFITQPHYSILPFGSGEQLQMLSRSRTIGRAADILEDGRHTRKPVDTGIDYQTQFVDQSVCK